MKSFTARSYWDAYYDLPTEIQTIANNKFTLWKLNPFHPSLQFKCVNAPHNIWSVRITRNYRALGVMSKNEIVWYWAGSHKEYEKLIKV